MINIKYKVGSKIIFVYYLILFLLFMIWHRPFVDAPIPARMLFLVAMFLPIVFEYNRIGLFVITFFFTLSYYGVSYSLMATEKAILTVMMFSIALFGYKNHHIPIPRSIISLLFLIVFVDLVYAQSFSSVSFVLIMLICAFCTEKTEDVEYTRKTGLLIYIVLTLYLSVTFLIYKNMFAVGYQETEMEISGWSEHNYFGITLGIGIVMAFYNLLAKEKTNLPLEKILCIATVFIGLIVSIMNASRGALVAVLIPMLINLLLSDIRFKYKVLTMFTLTLFVIILFVYGYLDLIIFRFLAEVDSGDISGTGRTFIWKMKLDYFFNGDFVGYICGYGFENGFHMGMSEGRSFHNDMLAFLVDFGIIGLLLYLFLMILPIITAIQNRQNILLAIIGSTYLIICGLTLEPLNVGRIPIWVFWYLIYICTVKNKGATIQ